MPKISASCSFESSLRMLLGQLDEEDRVAIVDQQAVDHGAGGLAQQRAGPIDLQPGLPQLHFALLEIRDIHVADRQGAVRGLGFEDPAPADTWDVVVGDALLGLPMRLEPRRHEDLGVIGRRQAFRLRPDQVVEPRASHIVGQAQGREGRPVHLQVGLIAVDQPVVAVEEGIGHGTGLGRRGLMVAVSVAVSHRGWARASCRSTRLGARFTAGRRQRRAR